DLVLLVSKPVRFLAIGHETVGVDDAGEEPWLVLTEEAPHLAIPRPHETRRDDEHLLDERGGRHHQPIRFSSHAWYDVRPNHLLAGVVSTFSFIEAWRRSRADVVCRLRAALLGQ